MTNRAILFAGPAPGDPHPGMFASGAAPEPELTDGAAVVRTLWLSMDPFVRMQMTGAPGGPPQLQPGQVVISRGVGQVIASRRDDLKPGDFVVCDPGWQERALVSGPARVVAGADLARAALGVLGPSGLTAWFALHDIMAVRAGETVLVTAAAGSVGSAACQIALADGAHVIAVASGPEQCAFVRALGVEAVIDRLATDDLAAAVRAAAPGGIAAALDTVGGAMFEAILANAAPRARIVMAGFISAYGGDRPRYVDPYALVFRRVQVTGFLLADHAPRYSVAQAALDALFAAGKLQAHETVADGLDAAPAAFCGLFQSPAPGKQLVRVADPS